jgi:hypothetical protein
VRRHPEVFEPAFFGGPSGDHCRLGHEFLPFTSCDSGGHKEIKKPESRRDLRYRLFRIPLAAHYAIWSSERPNAASDDAAGEWRGSSLRCDVDAR